MVKAGGVGREDGRQGRGGGSAMRMQGTCKQCNTLDTNAHQNREKVQFKTHHISSIPNPHLYYIHINHV